METNHSQTMLYYREPEPMLTAHDKLFEVLSTRRGESHPGQSVALTPSPSRL